MTPLAAPGWAVGVLRRLPSPPRPLAQPRFSEQTRLGFLERAANADLPQAQPPKRSPRQTPFLGLHEGPLAPWELLAQHADGCCGLVWTPPTQETRHVLGVARALGMPVWLADARLASPHLNQHTLLEVGPDGLGALQPLGAATAHAPHPAPRAPRREAWPPGLTRVLPWGALPPPPHPPDAPVALELMWGQAEEVELALEAARTRRARGVGLVRLEYILGADPGMTEEELGELLAAMLAPLVGLPVAVRLADWSPDKPPPYTHAPLLAWNGDPGLQGLPPETRRAQLQALGWAAQRAGHREVWAVLPRARPGDERRARQDAPPHVRLGAMLEDWSSLAAWRSFEGCDFWIGLGDLGRARRGPAAWDELAARCAQLRAAQQEVWVCGPSWGPTLP